MDQYSFDDTDSQIRLRGAWEQVLLRLASEISPAWMERFIKPLAPKDFTDGVATLVAPGKFVREWIRERYADKLQEMLSDEFGEPVGLRLVAAPQEKPSVPTQPTVAKPPIESTALNLVERYSFESFIIGPSNRLAYAGAKAVADQPGNKYNPLFIYGPSGVGKTHLLHSIAREILNREPGLPIVYVSAQQFAEQFVNALQTKGIDQFRRSQRTGGIWLVDDIQFIAGKDRTQEELFHTFNHLHTLGKQIVLCSDRPPRDLVLMDERLRSRFEAGLVADIQPPDTETRCAILLSKAKQEGIEISNDLAMYLAENVPGNVRILEGALTKIAAQASVEDHEIDTETAERVIEQYYRNQTRLRPSFGQIVGAVSGHYRISVEDICGQSRKAPIVHARHVAVYLVRELTGDSWKQIGSLFGDRDHTSMMHGHRKVSELIAEDREVRSTVKVLMRNLFPDG